MKFREYPKAIYAQIGGFIERLIQHKAVSSRIAKLQILAEQHPKRAVAVILGTMAVLSGVTVYSIYSDLSHPDESELLPLNEIAEMNRLFQAKHSAEEFQQHQKEDFRHIILEGRQLRTDLDSLMALSKKSHHDSLEIVRKHKELTYIVHYLEADNHEEEN